MGWAGEEHIEHIFLFLGSPKYGETANIGGQSSWGKRSPNHSLRKYYHTDTGRKEIKEYPLTVITFQSKATADDSP